MLLAIFLSRIVLPAFGGGDDQASLALADGRDHVDQPDRKVAGGVGPLERIAFVGMDGRQLLERFAREAFLHHVVVDLLDIEQRV